MEIIVLLIVMLTGVATIAKTIEEGRKEDAERPPMRPIEESIDEILAKIRRERQNRRQREVEEWEDLYFRCLPVTEHPDYFKLNPATDDVETFVSKGASGMVVAQFESRTSASGIAYQAKLDYVTKTIEVSTSRISWRVPFSEVDNYTQYM